MIDTSMMFFILVIVLVAPHLSEASALKKARLCAALGLVFFIVGVVNGTA